MNTLFSQPLKVINAGLQSFANTIQQVGGEVIALNWQPPAQGDIATGLDLATLLAHPLVEQANQIAMARYLEAQPVLIDVMSAHEAIPALAQRSAFCMPVRRSTGRRCVARSRGDHRRHPVRRLGR
ncbi:hypothetical protein O0544_22225 [Edwardsiella anguillarum]|nr:hypothetical protein [Edwardsiella anguillarum]